MNGAGTEFDSGNGNGYGGGDGMGRGGEMDGRVAELETIYFDFDRAVIRDDQKPTLRQNAQAIKNHADWRQVVIEGHCDERGSEEYNLALGERRANTTKRYLVDTGVSAARLDTVSFGESRPAVQGHDESAWKWNRRAEFRVVR
ncbi:MAG: peptidoglycan-associated lipoprotein Pal [Myxococcota bacterium]|nr:peptidoglycan-associated lipoprotein Pal [Myxococcota bacterium]